MLTEQEFASKKAEILAMAPIGFVEEKQDSQAAKPAPAAKPKTQSPTKKNAADELTRRSHRDALCSACSACLPCLLSSYGE